MIGEKLAQTSMGLRGKKYPPFGEERHADMRLAWQVNQRLPQYGLDVIEPADRTAVLAIIARFMLPVISTVKRTSTPFVGSFVGGKINAAKKHRKAASSSQKRAS